MIHHKPSMLASSQIDLDAQEETFFLRQGEYILNNSKIQQLKLPCNIILDFEDFRKCLK